MATYVLIHGAGSTAWYWHLVVPMLEDLGHEVVAPNLPISDDSAGFPEYADTVIDAIGDRSDIVVVAQSLGGFTAALVADRIEVDLVVMVAAMIPLPGERPDDWWTNTGYEAMQQRWSEETGRNPDADFDVVEWFFHDVPAAVTAEALVDDLDQSGTPMEQPWPLDKWPDVPTRFLLGRNDRFFPPEFLRGVVQDRLGIVPDEMESGHLPALANPTELVRRLEAYRIEAFSDM